MRYFEGYATGDFPWVPNKLRASRRMAGLLCTARTSCCPRNRSVSAHLLLSISPALLTLGFEGFQWQTFDLRKKCPIGFLPDVAGSTNFPDHVSKAKRSDGRRRPPSRHMASSSRPDCFLSRRNVHSRISRHTVRSVVSIPF